MARSTDNLAAYRSLMGSPVEIALVGITHSAGDDLEAGLVRGVVWSPASLEEITSTAKWWRAEFGMSKAKERDTLFVMIEGGRMVRAEVNVETGKGFGVVLPALVQGSRHRLSDAEIAQAHSARVAA